MHGSLTNAQRIKPLIRHSKEWTMREHEVFIEHWPDKEMIAALLPHRTMSSILTFAGRCNLRKKVMVWTTPQDTALKRMVKESRSRAEIAAQLGCTTGQVTNRMRYTGICFPRRQRTPTGNELFDSIAQRCDALNLTLTDLDEMARTRRVFRSFSRARKLGIESVVRAVNALDGKLVIQWSSLDEG